MTLDETYSKWLSLQPLTENEQRMLSMRFTVEYNYNSNHLCVFRSIPVHQFRQYPFSPLVIFSTCGKVNTFFSNSRLKGHISLTYARFCPDKPLR